MRRTILFMAILFLVELALVWRPFETEAIAWQSSSKDRKISGQMTERFHLLQVVPPKLLTQPIPRKHITHWWRTQRKLHAHGPNCFAIRFATFHRTNSGEIEVGYVQGSSSQAWRVDASELTDGYRRFCPIAGLAEDKNLRITINGLTSEAGQTVASWMSYSPPLKPAIINGKRAGKLSLNLRLVYFQHVNAMKIAGLERGAFFLTCLLSLIIAIFTFSAAKPAPEASVKNK